MRGWQTKLPGVGLALLLGGCDLLGNVESGPACPNVAILADAAHQTHYADGAGRDLTDIAYQADLTSITGECRFDFDDSVNGKNPTKVTITMDLALKAVIGPASKARHVDLTYFIAIVDPKHKVLARQEFNLPVDFQDARGAYFGKDQLEQEIPLGPKDKPAGFQVLVGLKLDQDEVDRNRARRKTN